MSRSIIKKHILKTILRYTEKAPTDISIGITSCVIAMNGMYAYGTKHINHKVVVKSKYTYCKNGYTDFMVIDESGKHYNMSNSVWYWKWNSIEDWNKMEPGKTTVVTYFGWRIPILGLFPIIIHSDSSKSQCE